MMKHIREHEVSGVHIEAPHARTLKHLVAPWTVGSSRMWVGMTKIEPRSRSNRHKHPGQEEIFYVISGRGQITVGIENDSIEPGSLILVPPGVEHVLFNDGDETLKVLSMVSPPFERSEFDLQHGIVGGDR
jgi:quercetin dioxygenase-like cupin family protein